MEELKVSIFQLDIKWENIESNIERVGAMLHDDHSMDVLVLPEMWTTGFSMHHKDISEKMDGKAIRAMKDWAEEYDILILGSLIIKDEEATYNRCCCVFPDDRVLYYDKKHLFTYANEDRHYSAGSTQTLLTYKGWKIYPLICYDLRFPSWARYSDEVSYDILIYMANWPARRGYAWTQLLKARAIENQSYVIGANRRGIDGNNIYYDGRSTIIDYSGEVLSSASNVRSHLNARLIKSSLDNFRKNFPFLMDRDVK